MSNLLYLTLQRLEKHLQDLIEGSTARLFPSYDLQKELGKQLVEAMQVEIRSDSDGKLIAPNLFTLFLPDEQAHVLQTHPDLLEGLTNDLLQACQDTQVGFLSKPVIKVIPNPEQGLQEIQIIAQFNLSHDNETSTLEPMPISSEGDANPQAFLIVDGIDIFQLDGKMIQIGQNKENELVIDHPQVDQVHAQLRLINGQYTIFDLNSVGGTFVNGVKVSQSLLYSGDVISLGGVPLVFGIEHPADLVQTQKLLPNT